ncbi:MAG: acyltransferase [Xenococcaceae cyanobacterium MO_207.B15]|nr:acyltransferase [Xenococcaceae cyanobacterium MO_207.B15]
MADRLHSHIGRKIITATYNRLKPLLNSWRVFLLKIMGIEIGNNCNVAANVTANLGFANQKKGVIEIDSRVEISQGVVLDCWGGSIQIEENVFLGPYSVIYGHGGVKIGRDTLIAMHSCILSSNHTIPDSNIPIRSQPDIPLPVTIGQDVWLGARVTVLGGVTIGDGCIVGAGAVVTKDLPPYSIAVGIPAQVIRQRPEKISNHILNSDETFTISHYSHS